LGGGGLFGLARVSNFCLQRILFYYRFFPAICVVVTPFGSFCFNVLPFGLTNAVSYFQSVMEQIFREFLWDIMVVYLDDLCVSSNSEEEHLAHLEKVFKVCVKWGVCLKFKKCNFFQKEFKYLGFICSSVGLRPDPAKDDALVNRSAPTNVKELRSFICFGSYLRRFVVGYADLTAPLVVLLKKGARWDWNDECQRSLKGSKKFC
jgi:hypothetical protein